MDTYQAREYLKRYHKAEFSHYINTKLADDFAVALAEDHERISYQLRAELEWRRDNNND